MKNLLTLLTIIISFSLSAQSIVRSNINAVGGVYNNGSLVLSQSIGQSANTKVFKNQGYLRQGFQQSSPRHFSTEEIEIGLFPNPNDGQFSFTLQGGINGLSFSILDVQGRHVKNSTPIQNSQTQVTVQNFAAGVYILSIQNQKGIVQQEKFIIY